MKRPITALVAVFVLASCSGGDTNTAVSTAQADGADRADQADVPDAADSGDQADQNDPTDSASAASDLSPADGTGDPDSDETGSTAAPVSSDSAPSSEPSPAETIVEVPATGVPGLDSDDAFCAAWSRFGGSWQVLLVGSTFLDDPERVATWEIAAARTIGAAYVDLIDRFPEQLAREQDDVAEFYFGALLRRSETALGSLRRAGASSDDERRLDEAWLAALERRDPLDADLALVIPDDLRALVDSAADDFRSQRVEFHLDPSMVVVVSTPLTDAHLETACPDQGTLTGQEVDGG